MSMFGQPTVNGAKVAGARMDGAKPLASLSSTLLARKGQAKPAMRPQGYGGFGAMTSGQDDLGWNDMGDPAPAEMAPPISAPVAAQVSAPVPQVLVQREVLAEEISAPLTEREPVAGAALTPVSVATAARLGRETAKKRGKAAFTLRLDPDRHLRLRLASALHNASAQTLVTEALDTFLQALPEVEALVAQIPPRTTRHTREAKS